MEEEKAAAYYVELTRKGEGAARFKQGLGFSSIPNTIGNSNDAVPTRGSALVSFSSFLSSFVRASSPSKTTDFEKQAQLQTMQNKLKKKPNDYDNSLSSRVSKRKTSRSPSPGSPSWNLKRRSRSRSRDEESHSRRRSRSQNWDAHRSKRPHRSRNRIGSRYRDGDKHRERERERRLRDRRLEKVGKDRTVTVDYNKLIEKMTPAERVKAKMKLQLSEIARKYETKSMASGWERFDFDKDAPLDDEEIEDREVPLFDDTDTLLIASAVEDDGALVNHIGKSFRFSAVETRREEQIKAAHDKAIFGAPSLLPLPPSTETDDEAEEDNCKKDISENAPATNLISGQVLTMQQGSWRDRAHRS